MEKVEVKTMQGTDIRIVQKDENVPVKKDEQSGLYFKLKYNINKYVVDKVIDAVADKIPLGLGKMCKDYIKSDKDTNVYSDDENVKRTQVELDVPKKNAELYQMNEFRDREKKYLPITNLVSSNKLTKSVGYIIKCFGNSVSRTYASYSRQEYEEVKELAKKRREDYKLTWTETIKGVIDVMADTSVDKRTQHLDVNSKDQKGGVFNFKTQEGRIKFYIQMMRKGGELE